MRNSKLIKKSDNRIFFRIFVALLWSKEILLDYFRGAIMKIPVLSAMSDYIIPTVLFLMFLLSYKIIISRLRGSDFVFVMLCILIYVANFFFYKRNRAFFQEEWMDFAIGCLPFYFVGVALKSDDEGALLKLLYRISCLSVLAFCAYILFVNQMDESSIRDGDMNNAYNILPHACMTFYYMLKEFRWYRLVIFLLSALALLMLGTRGAVLCLLVFIVLCSALTVRFKHPLVLLAMVVVCLLFVFFQELTDWLMNAAYSICESLGLSTRVFDKIMSGDFAVSDARVNLKDRVQHYLLAYPLVGLGIYGDRFVSGGQYAHNLFLEIYGQFGILMGTIITVALVAVSYRGIRNAFKSKDKNAQMIILLLLGYCFKLLVSGSYLREAFFWLMLGYFVAVNRNCTETEKTKSLLVRRDKLIN